MVYGKGFVEGCFCGRMLADARSIYMGHGPVCAGIYGPT
ncbi:DUF6011 domain-containing protein [Armatimonas sp.]